MNPKIYQTRAAATMKGGEPQDQLYNFFFGAFGEAGEITDLLKKVFWHHHDLDLEMLSKELGDAFWYTVALCTVWGAGLSRGSPVGNSQISGYANFGA